MTVHYAIDSLTVRDDRLFGWGWLLSERAAIEHIEIRIPYAGGETVLSCLRAGARSDLAQAFPHVPHAASAGFIMLGRIPAPDVGRVATVVAHLEDGTNEVRELPDFPHRYIRQSVRRTGYVSRLRNAVRHLRERGLRSVFARACAQLADAVATWWRKYAPQPARPKGRRPVVVFDHALGGGANRFRDEWVARRLLDGDAVHVVTPMMARLVYQVSDHVGPMTRMREFAALGEVLAALNAAEGCDVVINNLVSFDAPLEIVHWACSQKRRGAHVTFFLHDYFAVSPSWTLVDDRGRYCGLPSPDRCRDCLARNVVPFLSFYDNTSIGEWRSVWAGLLAECDEIVAFSRASAAILSQAFPAIAPERILIRPHRVDYLPSDARARPSLEMPLVVAVIGHISEHKGSGILRAVVNEVRRSGAPLRFKVFGSIDNLASSDVLDVVGPYRVQDLPALIEQHGVGICMLPSICPETFSYVTSEIIHFGMPLAVFDLGAPAERARGYEFGRVLTSMEPAEVIGQLLQFGEDLKSRLQPSTLRHAQLQDRP